MDVVSLVAAGKELGLDGAELKQWVEAAERERRAADREAAKEAAEARKAEAELIDKKLQLCKLESERLAATAPPVATNVPMLGLQKGMAPFDAGKDDLHAYLLRFERVAKTQKWPESHWAASLSMCLTGEALGVYSRLTPEECGDYSKVKAALLKRFRLTAEGFRGRFRNMKPEDGETGSQFVTRLSSYFDRWVEFSNVQVEDYAALRELLIREQFIGNCSAKVAFFLKEKKLKTLDEVADAADDYIEAHGIQNFGHGNGKGGKGGQGQAPPKTPPDGEPRDKSNDKPKAYEEAPLKCYLCNRTGHMANQCRSKWYRRGDPIKCSSCGKMGHKAEVCRSKPEGHGHNEQTGKTQSACFVATESGKLRENIENGFVELKNGEKVPVINAVLSSKMKVLATDLPVVEGRVGETKVSVLRDTGSNTIVIRKGLVDDSQLTGQVGLVYLVDGTMRKLPEALVNVQTPFFSGYVVAKVMESPLYDVILGNAAGVRAVDDPDEDWDKEQEIAAERTTPIEEDVIRPEVAGNQSNQVTQCEMQSESNGEAREDSAVTDAHISDETTTAAVITRSKSAEAKKPIPKLRVPQIEGGPNDVAALIRAQDGDMTLRVCRDKVGQQQSSHNTKNTFEFIKEEGVLYRQYRAEDGTQHKQLAVPKPFRGTVLQLAHEGIMAGHLGVKKTAERILMDFFWPGLQADVQRFVRSCDSCQKTTPKGRIVRAPLQTMPKIDTPFKRVAIDIVGPFSPPSRAGHRYILTLVDFATRYPDAIPLRTIETERVAEGLLEIFSRVGIPREVLSDRGSCFVSGLMREVGRLLSIKQIQTTPYHPMGNGLVERFNGTLKGMLRKMCEEKPSDWDRYLPALLFAYREVPQESLGFSPFEMLYGRQIRGPLTVLKELWTKTDIPEETRTTYEYVVDLRNRLEQTCRLAHETLEKSSARYRRLYNAKARERKLAPGDEVLILLPTDNNKLLMHWKGPFLVTSKRGAVDYEVDVGATKKMFHVNLLKKYERREGPNEVISNANAERPQPEQSDADVQKLCATISGTGTTEDEDRLFIKLTPSEDTRDVIISQDIGDEKTQQLKQLLHQYSPVFSDVPGKTDLVQCSLKLTTDRPIHIKQYPLPYALRDTVGEEVEQMLQMGVIEPSKSAYNSPVVVVKKADKTNRLCIDFRRINSALISNAEPIPNSDDIFVSLARKRIFSKLDLSKGYWQVPLDDESRPITAFSTSTGLYQFRYMPFGIKTAPAVFTQLMRQVFAGMPDVVHYYDDVLVASENWEQHMASLDEAFERLQKAGLTARPKKCELGFSRVTFLGHEIGQGVKIPLVKTLDRIQQAARPTTKRQIRSFLGLSGYYREFIPGYAALAKPLTDATRKGAPNSVVWTENLEEAFKALKSALSSPPVLRLPDLQRRFTLRTDASDSSLGAVLLQEHDGVLHPVSFASRKLTQTESSYAAVEKEGLALIWGIHRFRPYLEGVPFTVQTDHRPLQYINKCKHANQRVLRWSLMLQEYDFKVEYIRGSENVGADYLSRIY